MFMAGSADAEIPQNAGFRFRQEVFKLVYFGPVAMKGIGKIQLCLLRKIPITWIRALSFMCHWEPICLLGSVRGGGKPREVFSQTGTDLPWVFFWLLQFPLILVPVGSGSMGISCTVSWGCAWYWSGRSQENEDRPCRSGWKNVCPLCEWNSRALFKGVNWQAQSCALLMWCFALFVAGWGDYCSAELFQDQPLRAWNQPGCPWNVWYGDRAAVDLERTEKRT